MLDLEFERKSRNLTQQDVADACGISRSYVAAIECGIRSPHPKVAKRIGKLFGIDWTEFFYDED